MRAHLVVVLAPRLDDDLGLGAGPEPFEAQALVAELAVETLRRAILPGLARIDQGGLDALIDDPLQKRARDELGTVVGPKIQWRAALADQTRQHLDHAARTDAAVDFDGKTFLRPLVGDGEALQLLAAGAPVEDEVVRPHLVRTRWCIGPRTTGRDPLAGSFARNLQLRTPPQTMRPARTHRVTI